LAETDIDRQQSDPLLGSLSLERSSTAERAAEVLREQILLGRLPPGTSLREQALSQSLGISRTTVRESFRLLAQEGLVSHSPHRGVTVTRLTPNDVLDLYEARIVLERAAVPRAISASAATLGPLAKAVSSFTDAATSKDWLHLTEADFSIHEELVALLESPRLTSFFHGLISELRLALALVDLEHAQIERQVREHEDLLALLMARREGEALAALQAHLTAAAARLSAVVGSMTSART
jgi:DNA-binding GntR family transcriptional regulator